MRTFWKAVSDWNRLWAWKMNPSLRRTRTSFGHGRAAELIAQNFQASLLHGAEGPDQRQERRLARPRGTGHDHDLAARDLEVVVEEDLLAQFAFAVVVIQVADADDRIARRMAAGSGRVADRASGRDDSGMSGISLGQWWQRSQNNSAGSASRSLRIARHPEAVHMPSVSTKTKAACESFNSSNSPVPWASAW